MGAVQTPARPSAAGEAAFAEVWVNRSAVAVALVRRGACTRLVGRGGGRGEGAVVFNAHLQVLLPLGWRFGTCCKLCCLKLTSLPLVLV